MSFSRGGVIRWLGSPRPPIPRAFEPRDDELAGAVAKSIRDDVPLILIGGVGVGKTTAMMEIDFWLAVGSPLPARLPPRAAWTAEEPNWWTTADAYVEDVRAGMAFSRQFDEWSDLYSAEGLAARAPRLFLDDLGVERETAYSRDEIAKLLRARYDRRLPTWITSNLDLEGLEQRYGAHVLSRLCQMATVVPIEGADRRLLEKTA